MKRFFALSLLANRFPVLHGIRVLAIVSVLQVHVSVVLVQRGLLRDPTLFIRSIMVWFGMDLFFLLSGFLIGSMLLHHERAGGIGRFYLRRAFRTFPLYYVVLVAMLVFAPKAAATATSILCEFLYCTNYMTIEQVHVPWAWSLAVEEHFYLAVPLLVGGLLLVRSARARLLLLAALFASGCIVRLWIVRTAPFRWNDDLLFTRVYVRTHARYDVLVAGITLAFLQHQWGDKLRAFFASWPRRIVFYAAAALCLRYLLLPYPERSRMWPMFAWGTVSSLMYLALCLPLLNHEGIVARALGAKPFLYVATLGYGVYLIHIPVCEWLIPRVAGPLVHAGWDIGVVWWLSVATLFGASLVASYALHLTIEKPALWLRDRFAP